MPSASFVSGPNWFRTIRADNCRQTVLEIFEREPRIRIGYCRLELLENFEVSLKENMDDFVRNDAGQISLRSRHILNENIVGVKEKAVPTSSEQRGITNTLPSNGPD